MVEKPDELEFLKRSYLRHLETSEPPTLVDLLDQAPPEFSGRFQDFVITHYFETGKIGECPFEKISFKEAIDRAIDYTNSLSPLELQKFRRSLDPTIPHFRIVKPKE